MIDGKSFLFFKEKKKWGEGNYKKKIPVYFRWIFSARWERENTMTFDEASISFFVVRGQSLGHGFTLAMADAKPRWNPVIFVVHPGNDVER